MQNGTYLRLVMQISGQHEALKLFEAFRELGLIMVSLQAMPPGDCYQVDGWHHAERGQLELQQMIEERYCELMGMAT